MTRVARGVRHRPLRCRQSHGRGATLTCRRWHSPGAASHRRPQQTRPRQTWPTQRGRRARPGPARSVPRRPGPGLGLQLDHERRQRRCRSRPALLRGQATPFVTCAETGSPPWLHRQSWRLQSPERAAWPPADPRSGEEDPALGSPCPQATAWRGRGRRPPLRVWPLRPTHCCAWPSRSLRPWRSLGWARLGREARRTRR
mmetsp:Transcript_8464/g.33449  ORF Transcript_8464/g.33449 Transcript_8464/m.33449 type:complete len:200 (-) Transcript_8464:981-1580(-)